MVDLPTESDPVRVIEGDCLDVLPALDIGGPVYVLTDPPYGIRLASNGTWFRSMRVIAGDNSQEVGQKALDWFAEREWPVLAFASPLKPWRGDWRQALAWDKGGAVGIGGDRRTCWKQSWEMIQVGRLFPEVFGTRDESVLDFPMMPTGSADHPAAKSLALMRYLVRKLVPPGGLILDPFAGSGTTGVAASLEGRRCLLIEKEPTYAAICRERIAKVTSAGLFAEVM